LIDDSVSPPPDDPPPTWETADVAATAEAAALTATAAPHLPSFRGIPVDVAPTSSTGGSDVTPKRRCSVQKTSPITSFCRRVAAAVSGSIGGSGGGGGGGGGNGGGRDPDDFGSDDDAEDDDEEEVDLTEETIGADDPSWDQYERRNFAYVGGVEGVARERARRSLALSSNWRMIHLDPATVLIDPSTSLIFPWRASRPFYGVVPCFPAPVDLHLFDEEYFFSCLAIGHGALDYKLQKAFATHFPNYVSGESLLGFLARVVEHGLHYKFFVPPVQKLQVGHPLGVWTRKIPPVVLQSIELVSRSLLASCYKSKYTNLTSVPEFEAIVEKHHDGYDCHLELASFAGVPCLTEFTQPLNQPIQRQDNSLASHGRAFQQYLQHLAMNGVYWSDRYFFDQFMLSLHPSVRAFFYPVLSTRASAFPMSHPLPPIYGPIQITSHMLEYARSVNKMSYVTESPRSLTRSQVPQLVREITTALTSPVHDSLVAAVDAARVRTCYICEKPDHLAQDCPLLLRLADDAARQRIVRRFAPPGPRRALGRESRPRPAAAIRAIEAPFADRDASIYDADEDNLSDSSVDGNGALPLFEAGEGPPLHIDDNPDDEVGQDFHHARD
jgi:hypothetical protein